MLMPDHLHFIVALKTDSLPKLMHSLKSYTAKQVNAVLNRQVHCGRINTMNMPFVKTKA